MCAVPEGVRCVSFGGGVEVSEDDGEGFVGGGGEVVE